MSLELTYDPNSFPVQGIIIVSLHEVDIPSGLPNTLNNPDLSQVEGVDSQFWKVENKEVVRFTGADVTKKTLFDGPASQAAPLPQPGPIKILLDQKTISDSFIFANDVKAGAHIRWIVSNGKEVNFGIESLLVGQSLDLLNSVTGRIQISISSTGEMKVSKLRGVGSYDVALDANYL